VREKNIIVGVVAVPADHAQEVADELIDSGVRIIFNYSEALLDVPRDVTVHTSNPPSTCCTRSTSTSPSPRARGRSAGVRARLR
jgi:hypothetical protein